MQEVSIENEWAFHLKKFPPLLTPKQIQQASQGIIKAADIYRRNKRNAKRLHLDVRIIAGKVFVTKQSLIAVLCGQPEMAL